MRFLLGLRPYLKAPPGESDSMSVALLSVSAVASLWPAFLNRVLFDRAIPDRNPLLILPVAAAVLLFESLGLMCRYKVDRLLALRSRESRQRRRVHLMERIWTMPMSWYDDAGPGTVVRYHDDATTLGNLRAEYIRSILGPILVLAVLMPVMVSMQPLLAAVRLLAVGPALFIGTRFLGQDLALERSLWSLRRRLATELFQGARGIESLRAAGDAGGYSGRLRKRLYRLGGVEESRALLGARWEAVAGGLGRFGGAVGPAMAAALILTGRLTFGSYIAFSILASRCMTALGELLGGFRTLARAGNAAARFDALQRASCAGNRARCLAAASSASRGLRIRNLSFTYPGLPPGAGTVLRDFHFTAGEGEWIHLSGPSGAGKSTLLALILGFRTPDSGLLTWRGLPLPECPASRRGRLVGAVLQEPAFFDGTVRDNLCLFAPSPGDRRVRAALEAAAAEDIVSRIPGGLDGRLFGEDAGLSGGERRRMAVARLLIDPPPLILLDEPVSGLDAQSAAHVSESLDRCCRGRTALLIHHGPNLPLPVHRIHCLPAAGSRPADRSGIAPRRAS